MSVRDSELSAMCDDLSNIFAESALMTDEIKSPQNRRKSKKRDSSQFLDEVDGHAEADTKDMYQGMEREYGTSKSHARNGSPFVPKRHKNSKYSKVKSRINTGLNMNKSRKSRVSRSRSPRKSQMESPGRRS